MDTIVSVHNHENYSSLCVRKWRTRFDRCEHVCSQMSQENGFSPVWVSLCCFKSPLRAKDFPHTSQENGFSPVCVRVWTVRWSLLEKVNSHWEQEYGLSPVWVNMCLVRADLSEQVYLQTSHEYGCSPVWVRTCLFKLPLTVNDFPQSEQTWGFSPLWTIKCLFRSRGWLKHLSQISHRYFFDVFLVPTTSVSVFSWESAWSLFKDSSLCVVVVDVIVVPFLRQSTKDTLTSNLQRFITILLCSGRPLDDGWSSLSSTGSSSSFTKAGCWLNFSLIE